MSSRHESVWLIGWEKVRLFVAALAADMPSIPAALTLAVCIATGRFSRHRMFPRRRLLCQRSDLTMVLLRLLQYQSSPLRADYDCRMGFLIFIRDQALTLTNMLILGTSQSSVNFGLMPLLKLPMWEMLGGRFGSTFLPMLLFQGLGRSTLAAPSSITLGGLKV